VFYIDHVGNTIQISSGVINPIAPAIPELILSLDQENVTFYGTILFGIVFSISIGAVLLRERKSAYDSYIESTNMLLNEKTNRSKDGNNKTRSDTKNETSVPAENKSDVPQSGNKSTLIDKLNTVLDDLRLSSYPKSYDWAIFAVLSILVVVGVVGILALISLKMPELAIIVSFGLFMLATIDFIALLSYSSRLVARKKIKASKAKLGGLIGGILLYIFIVLVFVSIYNVPWFRFYIWENARTFGPVSIPSALYQISYWYASSILLIGFLTFSQVAKIDTELREMMKNGSDLEDIFLYREKKIGEITKGLIKGAMLFLILMGYSLIFSTDLTNFKSLGITLGFGLVIGVVFGIIATIISGTLQSHKKKKGLVVDWSTCSKCGNQTIKGAYCINCGQSFVNNFEIMEKTKLCPKCHSINTEQAVFCRACRTELK
jgi:hypothetical protein